MNDRKEEWVKKQCFKGAVTIYTQLLKERRATRFDIGIAPAEIYRIAMVLFKDGKSRYWASYDEIMEGENETKKKGTKET